ncbi:hypothetical protein HNP38_000585 [Chryseobacterium defluvii]|uniref:C1q domain-containing protein n=1 Tax=Chryseobacterium defluvii TaxID=160396 RepID=A0A840KCQ3_9FLAO|nr:hypothetical protein [Chryseobacterium defluvii]MBB4805313.1 hypothetical protein [Chryseobacterium defluvii]
MRLSHHKIKKTGAFGLALFLTAHINAQMGVGTLNPDSNNAVEVAATEKFIVDKTGKIGVGVAIPKMAIDLRNGTNGSVGIGYTDKTASAAGAGAVRYVASPAIGVKGYLEFSDGTNWVGIYPKGKPRIVVMAVKTTQDTYVFESGTPSEIGPKAGIMQRRSSYLTNWTQKLDSDSGVPTDNFDPATGEFVAPRTGVYFATFTFALASSQVNTGSNNQTEAIWEVRNSSGTITQRVKTNNGYSSDTGASPNAVPVGSACTVSVYMNKGDKLRPFTWITVAFVDTTLSQFNTFDSGAYNALTIVEQ